MRRAPRRVAHRTALLLLAALPRAVAQPCDRSCEPRLQDVFGCCPEVPAGPFGRDRGFAPWPTVVRVTLPDGLLRVGKTEVSRTLYQETMGRAPSLDADCMGDCPVDGVSWCDAVLLANRLSARDWLPPVYTVPEGFTPDMDAATCDALAAQVAWNREARGWRLPDAAEWDLLAAAGPVSRDDVAWHGGNSGGHVHPVCARQPDLRGLCDLRGNLREWTWDPVPGPVTLRAVRGGSFATPPAEGDPPAALEPSTRDRWTGIRLVR